jgi:hypothetical protein
MGLDEGEGGVNAVLFEQHTVVLAEGHRMLVIFMGEARSCEEN